MGTKRGCAAVCPAVAVALALEELDQMRALESLPDPSALLERMRARGADFDLLAGVAGAYQNERGIVGGCNE